MDGKVLEFGCDAILCPPGTQGGNVHAITEACTHCPPEEQSSFFGWTVCASELNERQVLEDLYYNCNGGEWQRNDFWGSPAHICDWYGVGCDDQGRVTIVDLSKNAPKCAVIPSQLGRFPKLKLLRLEEG